MVSLYLFALDNPVMEGVFNAGFENLTNNKLADLIANQIQAKIIKTQSDDNRSYRLDSAKLLAAGFKPKFTVWDAINDLRQAYKLGELKDDATCYSVKWLKDTEIRNS